MDSTRGATPKLAPYNDPRITHGYVKLRDGIRCHYLYGVPKAGKWRATLFLIHGFPDLSFGWRYQVPLFLEMGLRVVAPDMMGYGSSDAPQDLRYYSLKRASDDIADLAAQLGASKIILGGHDWGGFVVYRCAEWHPELVSHVFSVCTPYQAPHKQYIPLQQVVERAPQFGYQIHLASGEIERMVESKGQIRLFLSGLFGGRSADDRELFVPQKGVSFDALASVGPSPLLSAEEMDLYVDEYAKHGLYGPCCWYRTREINWKDDLELPQSGIDRPVLFIMAERDNVLLPSMAKGIERHLTDVTVRSVPAAHWALWQTPTQVNEHLKAWFEAAVFGGSKL